MVPYIEEKIMVLRERGRISRVRKTTERKRQINNDRRTIGCWTAGDRQYWSDRRQGITAKLSPRRDGHFVVVNPTGPTTYIDCDGSGSNYTNRSLISCKRHHRF